MKVGNGSYWGLADARFLGLKTEPYGRSISLYDESKAGLIRIGKHPYAHPPNQVVRYELSPADAVSLLHANGIGIGYTIRRVRIWVESGSMTWEFF